MFKTYINEQINIQSNTDLTPFILESFGLVTQTHVYHLLTKSYAEHVAIGEFYEGLEGCVDVIAESAIGLGLNLTETPVNTELVMSYNKQTMIENIENYRNNVSDLIQKTNHKSIMSINEKLISIQQLIDNLLYKLQLV